MASVGARRIALVMAAIATASCNWLFDIEPQPIAPPAADVGVDSGPPANCASGSDLRMCGGSEVDLCSSAAHCGACGAKCADDPLVQCLGGVCHDHAFLAKMHPIGPNCIRSGGLIADQTTGLQWEAAPDAELYGSIEDATAQCDQLNAEGLDGHHDYALPTRIEAASLIVYGRSPPIPESCGGGITSGIMCTRSREPGTLRMYYVQVDNGAIGPAPPGAQCRARCVRATRAARRDDRYVETLDGIYDRYLDITWQRTPLTKGKTTEFPWGEGLNACKALNLDSSSDWNLPTARQLLSLIDEREIDPAIDPRFVETGVKFYWSFDVNASAMAYSVFFGNSLTGTPQATSTLNRVRCVRSGRVP